MNIKEGKKKLKRDVREDDKIKGKRFSFITFRSNLSASRVPSAYLAVKLTT
jgi:hypothetical protein